jgi:hypothetical protein
MGNKNTKFIRELRIKTTMSNLPTPLRMATKKVNQPIDKHTKNVSEMNRTYSLEDHGYVR